MSLLEVITKASSAFQAPADHESADHESDYPIVLNPEPVFQNLKPEDDETEPGNPVEKVCGWEISQTDNELMELGRKFCKKLRRQLKNSNLFRRHEFIDMLASHLVKAGEKVGTSLSVDKSAEGYATYVVEKLGFLLDRDVKGLVLEGCVSLEVWDVLECLIINGLVEHSSVSNLVSKLIEKRKSDLLVQCVKHLPDIQAYDLMCILKYLLVLPGDGYKSLVSVREDWERQALSSVDKASGKGVNGKEISLAKEAALLIMIAHDEFSVTELCLHYLLASRNFDEVIFSACVGKLSGEEIKALIRYLAKWLRKYERFPQVGPCPKASSALGLEICDWIPTLENVAKCLGMVVDEHFSSLVLHSEFHDLRSLERLVSSLAAEARFCATLSNLTGSLTIAQDYQHESFGNFTI